MRAGCARERRILTIARLAARVVQQIVREHVGTAEAVLEIDGRARDVVDDVGGDNILARLRLEVE